MLLQLLLLLLLLLVCNRLLEFFHKLLQVLIQLCQQQYTASSYRTMQPQKQSVVNGRCISRKFLMSGFCMLFVGTIQQD
jgi:hypothetical protein